MSVEPETNSYIRAAQGVPSVFLLWNFTSRDVFFYNRTCNDPGAMVESIDLEEFYQEIIG